MRTLSSGAGPVQQVFRDPERTGDMQIQGWKSFVRHFATPPRDIPAYTGASPVREYSRMQEMETAWKGHSDLPFLQML